MKYYLDVKQFHDKFGLVTPSQFVVIPRDLFQFRVKFFIEEFNEYVESYETQDLGGAIDALIDLIYITCGCSLLHGINDTEIFPQQRIYSVVDGELPEKPKLLPLSDHYNLRYNLENAIFAYQKAYENNDENEMVKSLVELYLVALDGAFRMGFDRQRWNILWDDVQRANMSKERAVRPEQSKRGSAWDVIKPQGWQGPKTDELVKQMLDGTI